MITYNDTTRRPLRFPVASVTLSRTACCGAALCALLLTSEQSQGADFSIRPTLTVSQEYTDNVFESSFSKKTDYITRAQPGLALKYSAPLWDWDLGYAFDYRYYARGSRSDDSTHNINGKGLVKLIDEVLFLELSDVYRRVSLDVTRDTTNESLRNNQTDQNVGVVSPYLVLHPTARWTLKTGYRYVNTWYKEQSAISKQDHIGFVNSSYELTPRFFLTGDYTFTRSIPERESSFYRHEAYLGPRFEYADQSFLFARGGFINSDYDDGRHKFNPSWDAGITHTFDTLIVSLATGMRYSDDPRGATTLESFYRASLTKNFQRGSVTLQGSYTEFSDSDIDKTKTKRYSGGFSSGYEIIQDLRGSLGFTYENYRDLLLDGTTEKYFVDCGVKYDFGKELTVGLNYKYINYSSEEIAADNQKVNRVILEVRKVF